MKCHGQSLGVIMKPNIFEFVLKSKLLGVNLHMAIDGIIFIASKYMTSNHLYFVKYVFIE